MAKKQNRRQVRIVDKQFQVGTAVRHTIAFAVLMTIGVGIMVFPSLYMMMSDDSVGEGSPAAEELQVLHNHIWPAIGFVMMGMFFFTLYDTHRIAGAAYRINSVLKAMLNGKCPSKVKLRRGDYLVETAELLDQYLARQRATSMAFEEADDRESVSV